MTVQCVNYIHTYAILNLQDVRMIVFGPNYEFLYSQILYNNDYID